MNHPLDPLLRPKSIAVVGATQREHTVGNHAIENLKKGKYPGALYAVNPGYKDVMGVPCFPSLADLPEPVEHVIFAISDKRIEEALDDAIAHGVRSITIMSSLALANDCDPPLKARVLKKVSDAKLLVCGANCMGFYNVRDRVLAGGFDTRNHEPPGNITLISQSGSGMSGIVDCDERMRFNLVVTTGQELTLSLEDYLDFALDLPDTKVVGLFLETSRKPEALLRAFAKANAKKIPIVAIKVGKTKLSKELTFSHSGAMAGSDKAFDAVFDRYGVQRVDDMDQLATALIMFAQPHPVGPGGFVSIHDSGGERQLTIDLAERIGLPFATLSDGTVKKLKNTLDPGLEPINPLDAWGAGGDRSGQIMRDCFAAMMADPGTSFGAVIHDRAPCSRIYPEYCEYLHTGHAASGKAAFLVSAHQGTGSDPLVIGSTENGFPVLDGLRQFLLGAKCLMDWRDHLDRAEDPVPGIDAMALSLWRERLDRPDPLNEAEACAMLRDSGIPAVESHVASNLQTAVDAARTLGYPVVLKTANPGVSHKTDHNAVHLDLNSDEDLKTAYQDVSQHLGPLVLVARHVPAGPELILGMHNDAQFGAVIMIGAGGITAELDVDAVFALAPFGPAQAKRMIDSLRMQPLLNGYRGSDAINVDALCDAAARLSVLGHRYADKIENIDINPVIMSTDGCIAVDALVITKSAAIVAPHERKAG